jgi:hypothetical protein
MPCCFLSMRKKHERKGSSLSLEKRFRGGAPVEARCALEASKQLFDDQSGARQSGHLREILATHKRCPSRN